MFGLRLGRRRRPVILFRLVRNHVLRLMARVLCNSRLVRCRLTKLRRYRCCALPSNRIGVLTLVGLMIRSLMSMVKCCRRLNRTRTVTRLIVLLTVAL